MADRRVTAEDGKYTVVIPGGIGATYERPYLLRHGEPWVANPHPNNVELAMAYEVLAREERVAALEAALRKAEKWCRTTKGYPTTESQLVASCAKEVGVEIDDA